MALIIRKGREEDLPRLLEIYNFEVVNGVATFDLEPLSLDERRPWLLSHNVGNHPLFVAEDGGTVIGYSTLSAFNAKAAYGSTVELSVYVAPEARGKGAGRALMKAALDFAERDEGTHRVLSLVTGGNEASEALHGKFGFRMVGTITEAGFKHGRYLDVGFWEKAV